MWIPLIAENWKCRSKIIFKYVNSAWDPILKKNLLKFVLAGPITSAQDPHKKTQSRKSLVFSAIQTYTKCAFAFSFLLLFLMHAFQLSGDNMHCSMGPVHFSRDPQVPYSEKIKKKKKIGPIALFTHLKIILLQCFQF